MDDWKWLQASRWAKKSGLRGSDCWFDFTLLKCSKLRQTSFCPLYIQNFQHGIRQKATLNKFNNWTTWYIYWTIYRSQSICRATALARSIMPGRLPSDRKKHRQEKNSQQKKSAHRQHIHLSVISHCYQYQLIESCSAASQQSTYRWTVTNYTCTCWSPATRRHRLIHFTSYTSCPYLLPDKFRRARLRCYSIENTGLVETRTSAIAKRIARPLVQSTLGSSNCKGRNPHRRTSWKLVSN